MSRVDIGMSDAALTMLGAIWRNILNDIIGDGFGDELRKTVEYWDENTRRKRAWFEHEKNDERTYRHYAAHAG